MTDQTQLILFYDGRCPLCVKEIMALKKSDHHSYIQLEDIHAIDFNERYPQLDRDKAEKILHGMTTDGKWLTGLDVTVKAWLLVDRFRWLRILRWPVIRPLADLAYRFFARYRQTIAFLLTGQRRCERCINNNE